MEKLKFELIYKFDEDGEWWQILCNNNHIFICRDEVKAREKFEWLKANPKPFRKVVETFETEIN
jgi:hypothetical protein